MSEFLEMNHECIEIKLRRVVINFHETLLRAVDLPHCVGIPTAVAAMDSQVYAALRDATEVPRTSGYGGPEGYSPCQLGKVPTASTPAPRARPLPQGAR